MRVFRQVTLGKVLKVIVVMRSLFIDRTIVKGYSENVYTEDGKVSACGLPFGFSFGFCAPGEYRRVPDEGRGGGGPQAEACQCGAGALYENWPPPTPPPPASSSGFRLFLSARCPWLNF